MGANDYTLTLDDGEWIFTVVPRMMGVGLGTNVDSVVLLRDGALAHSSNGATKWRANRAQPVRPRGWRQQLARQDP